MERPRITFEYSLRWRFTRDGRPGPVNFRTFHTARKALMFVSDLEAGGDAPAGLLSIARREVGTYEEMDRLDLERAAVEEGRPPCS